MIAVVAACAVLAAVSDSSGDRTSTLYVQPLNMAIWPLTASEFTGITVVELPLALSLGESRGGHWAFEGTWSYAVTRWEEWSDAVNGLEPRRTDRARFIGSVGRAFPLTEGGFFVTPKALLVLGIDGTSGTSSGAHPGAPPLAGPELQTSLGFDVGYEWKFERWAIALVTGCSIGYVWSNSPPNRGPMGSLISPTTHWHRRGNLLPANVVIDPNMNLVRAGLRF